MKEKLTISEVSDLATHDDFEIAFEKGTLGLYDFLDFLETRADTERWEEVNLYNLVFKVISSGPLMLGDIREELALGPEISDEAVLSTITDGSEMGMVKGSEFGVATKEFSGGYKWDWFLMSDVALGAASGILIGRSTNFWRLTASNKLEALKVFMTAKQKKTVKMQICFGKVRTFQAGDLGAKSYSVMRQDLLLDALVEVLNKRFPGAEFMGADYTHTGTIASWTLPEQSDDLLGEYVKTCNAHGITKMDDFVPAITFYTSDAGMCAVTVKAGLINGKTSIDVGSAIRLDHIAGHSVSDFKESCGQLFAQYQDLIKQLEALLLIVIEHPVGCMKALGEQVGIPQKQLDKTVETFVTIHPDEEEEITAHEVFYCIEEAFVEMENAKISASTIEKCKENLARTLTKSYDWKSVDRI